MSSHPSSFTLDLYALGERPEVQSHLATCAECRAFLERGPIPALSPALRERAVAPRFRWAWPAFALAASAAAIVLWAQPQEIASKAAPAVAVYVRRGDSVSQWSGGSVQPGDALQLELASEGYAYEAVVGDRVFYRGAADAHAHAAPLSLVVDAAPGEEIINVVFSRESLNDDALRAAALARTRSSEIWVTTLIFPKELP